MRTLRLIPALLATAVLCLAAVPAAHAATTSELIDRALGRGEITEGQAALYRLQAVADWSQLPARYKGDTPEEGTMMLLQAQQALEQGDIASPTTRERVADRLEPRRRAAGTTCYQSNVSLPNEYDTTHFRFEYDPADISLAEVQTYGVSLEHAWQRNITEFGWAPPVVKATPATGGRLVVRLDPALDSGGILGYVSNGGTHAGLVGDNPATPWDDVDAYAACMVLRTDYSGSGGDAQMRATSHHEFHHMVQYGLGAGFPGGSVDLTFMEGGAKWVEDELDDSADRMHRYLWLDLRFPMGHYHDPANTGTTPSPYTYWLALRGLTERYGHAAAGGAEQVMQRFWERVSQGVGQLPAMEQAVADGPDDMTLARAFHDTAVANRFMAQCGGSYALPLCFTEGDLTLDTAAALGAPGNPYPAVDRCGGANCNAAAVPALGTRVQESVRPDYAAERIRLPAGSSPYRVALSNTDPASGPLWASVACDTGTALRVQPLGQPVPAGRARAVAFDPAGCGDVVVVVTNPNRTADNPGAYGPRAPVDVATGTAEAPLNVDVAGAGKVTSAPAGIDCGADCLEWYPAAQAVTLTPTPAAGSGKVFRGWSGACSGAGACEVTMSDLRSVTATFGDPRPTSTTLTCAPAAVAVGGSSTCTAVVADTGAGPLSPNGTVAFMGGGTATFGTGGSCTLAGTPRQCSVTFTPTGATGTRTVTATYGASGPHAGSADDADVHFAKRTTTTAVACAPASVIVGVATTCTATVAPGDGGSTRPGGAVTFTGGDGSFPGANSCPLPASGANACAVTFTPASPGALSVHAAYAGDGGHLASGGDGALTATKRPTATLVSCSPGAIALAATTRCTATVTDAGAGTGSAPAGAVAFSGGETCQLSGGACSVGYQGAAAGTQSVAATYGGDATHLASTDDTSFTVSVPPASDGDPSPPAPPSPTPTPRMVPDTFAPVFGPLAAPRAKLARFLTSGLSVPVPLSEPAAIQAQLTVDRATARRLKLARRVIARGSAAAGAPSVRLKADRRAARRLRRARRVRATLTIVATDAAGNAATRTLLVTLKR